MPMDTTVYTAPRCAESWHDGRFVLEQETNAYAVAAGEPVARLRLEGGCAEGYTGQHGGCSTGDQCPDCGCLRPPASV